MFVTPLQTLITMMLGVRSVWLSKLISQSSIQEITHFCVSYFDNTEHTENALYVCITKVITFLVIPCTRSLSFEMQNGMQMKNCEFSLALNEQREK